MKKEIFNQLLMLQRYDEFSLIPKICEESSLSCCDGVGKVRQSGIIRRNFVVNKRKFGGFIPDYLVGSKLLLNFAALTIVIHLNCNAYERAKSKKMCKIGEIVW